VANEPKAPQPTRKRSQTWEVYANFADQVDCDDHSVIELDYWIQVTDLKERGRTKNPRSAFEKETHPDIFRRNRASGVCTHTVFI
jgi:hypothetical protein